MSRRRPQPQCRPFRHRPIRQGQRCLAGLPRLRSLQQCLRLRQSPVYTPLGILPFSRFARFRRVGTTHGVDGDTQPFAVVNCRRLRWRAARSRVRGPGRPPLACYQRCAGTEGRTQHHIGGPMSSGVHAGVGDSHGNRAPRRLQSPGRRFRHPQRRQRPRRSGPEGMEELVGCGFTKRNSGRCSGSGRVPGERLEDDVGDARGNTQGQDSVKCRAPGLTGERCHDSGDAEPQFPLGGRSGEPPEEDVVIALGLPGDGLHQEMVQLFATRLGSLPRKLRISPNA